ncbi:PREDICTED: activating signal cointegrator 1 complex subunit 3-like [Priapulus caudatus]|uniref:Activating signal cointegrator 1 complex subunit 3-like n=1 Tax=Priapulus caudatus TaxID=37621 RepID=A0ABM1EKG5_PRICU|nr:PREDICTED: activating signal cointegrator 1 complex subunit 3-like [Priapulus caudatus]
MAVSTVPRLTGALRAFSHITADVDYEKSADATWLPRFSHRRESQDLTWSKLKSTLLSHSSKSIESLKELTHVAKDFVGSYATQDEVQSAATFLFSTLKDHESVSREIAKTLQQAFGHFTMASAQKALLIVKKLLSGIPEQIRDELKKTGDRVQINEEFGKGIKFTAPRDETLDLLSSDSETEDYQELKIDLKYHSPTAKKTTATGKSRVKLCRDQSRRGVSTAENRQPDASWLQFEVLKYFKDDDNELGLPVSAICASLFDMLSSDQTNEQLQNDLFDFLGFERIVMIEGLLQSRSSLLDSAFNQDLPESKLPCELQQSRPNVACTVTVQSNLMKQLKKQLRKEAEEDEKKFPFHKALRDERAAQLDAAAKVPLFQDRLPRTDTVVEKFPHVFDLYAEAKSSSAFVGGATMVLPDGFDRKDNKLYEEVNIPPTEQAPVGEDFHLIQISELDEIAQVAFRSTKQLNKIQSVVCETAYYSNENLLICAPTGAGKTNIAMLTVLHEIKKHIHQGVIKKDDFKVVYIAPMKALAAEMVRNFGQKLEPLGIQVKELTGDMQLTKTEIMQTQMLVTTPEKWDVVTRKGAGDVALTQLVRLLIIDEVHLLHDDRGAVLESLVARTLRQVESSQLMIRIVGLSATLPNYMDVAQFLRVNPYVGLFFFDGRFRPVPLGQTFIGVKGRNPMQLMGAMDEVCYEKVAEQVKNGHQVMVFVHARNATVRTAMTLRDKASSKNELRMFSADQDSKFGLAQKQMTRSRNMQMKELFEDGFSIHHAGMLRSDRNLVERFFTSGLIKVLCCTATLAWGVNLPAHAVIIKGTQIYDAKHGMFIDLGMLDVMQIFGRAGRPQYDKYGHGTIITSHDKLSHYLSLLTRQNPIESQFLGSLTDNLNAEVALGTVTNVEEAVEWLSYTYLFVRMRKNFHAYGIPFTALQNDPMLLGHRKVQIVHAARQLDSAHMVRFEERTGFLFSTDLGRIASHFYIKYDTVATINEELKSAMTEADILATVSKAQEFEQIKVRDDELEELDRHQMESCHLNVFGGTENTYGKVNVLIQSFISRARMDSFSLVSDAAYVKQNASRIIRALFEVCLTKGWPIMSGRLLTLSKVMDRQLWGFQNPMRQFDLPHEILEKLERLKLTPDKLREMDSKEIGHMVHHVRMGPEIKKFAYQIPNLTLEATIQPITRTVLKVQLGIEADFTWNDRAHRSVEPFWIWVEDPDNDHIYHSEYFLLQKKQVMKSERQVLTFTIPIFEPLPSQYYVRAISDRWLGSESVCPISFKHLIMPERHPPHTELLDLNPLPVSALGDYRLELVYSFSHFNPVQTQIFHCLYHTDNNALVGAPTGSGKTVAAELAIFRVFREYPKCKAVYVAPLKALVRERIQDWKERIEKKLGKRVVELTGDVTPDARAIANADLIVTTPEKWDGISRSWQTRNYVQSVALIVIDEIHLLGADRGPVLEVLVSRTNFISSHTGQKVRVVGLSTALANARDLADWLNIDQMGLFNFRPSVRPVPLEVHISGFPGKHYCPRMATMNKPTFQAIKTHSPTKPALIFVSSRRQTRVTALDMIAYLAAEDNPREWLHMPDGEMDHLIRDIRDANLKLTLAFGIGIHHAGLHEKDRKAVEELFVNQKIQVLVATSTLAWGVNFPAHLVVVKGTEYFDGKTKRYVDFPITDVLQMMGRAGRPQFDDEGIAVILVQDVKKHFYKKFLYEPFPVESSLLEVLPDHMCAEIVAGTISSKQDALEYLTWTYFFRRLLVNPSYYSLSDTGHDSINRYLSSLVERAVVSLSYSHCIQLEDDDRTIAATTLGRICSYYYLSHLTAQMFKEALAPDARVEKVVEILSNAHEYAELPVRHNEDAINSELAKQLPLEVPPHSFDSSHTKANLLLQAHLSRQHLLCSDYNTDTKSVMDQAIRILQALLDAAADKGWLLAALNVIHVVQMLYQGRWLQDSSLLTLPHVEKYHLGCFRRGNQRIDCLPELMAVVGSKYEVLFKMMKQDFDPPQIEQVYQVLHQLPVLETSLSIKGWWADGEKELEVDVSEGSGTRLVNKPWIEVHADQEYVLNVNLTRLNRNKGERRAHTPQFPKPKDEGWFLMLGEIDLREVLALKRIGFVRGRQRAPLVFYTPEREGRVIYTLYVMSDAYLGLDQQYDVCLDILPPSIEAQLNSELAAGWDSNMPA